MHPPFRSAGALERLPRVAATLPGIDALDHAERRAQKISPVLAGERTDMRLGGPCLNRETGPPNFHDVMANPRAVIFDRRKARLAPNDQTVQRVRFPALEC
jgi:hypothetical protein